LCAGWAKCGTLYRDYLTDYIRVAYFLFTYTGNHTNKCGLMKEKVQILTIINKKYIKIYKIYKT